MIPEVTNFRSMWNGNVGHEEQAKRGPIDNLSASKSDNSHLKVGDYVEMYNDLSKSKKARHDGSKILEETNVKALRNGSHLRPENGKNGISWTEHSSKSKSESNSGDDVENGKNGRSKYKHSPDSIRAGHSVSLVPKKANSKTMSGEDQRRDNRVDMKFMSDDFEESNSEFSSGEDVELEEFLFRQQCKSRRDSNSHNGVKNVLEDSKTTLPTSHKNQDDLKSMSNDSSNSESETSAEEDADSVERILVEKKGPTESEKHRGMPRLTDSVTNGNVNSEPCQNENNRMKSGDPIGVKKTRLGLHYWVDSSKREDKRDPIVAKKWPERLPPRLVSKSKKKKLALGVISNPIYISENEASDSSLEKDGSSSNDKDLSDHGSASDDETRDGEQQPHLTSKPNRKKQELGKISYSKKDEPRKSNRQHGVNERDDSDSSPVEECIRKYLMKRNKKSIRQAGKPSKRKIRASDDVWNILEFMWKEGDALETNLSPRKENAFAESALPLKFRIEFEVPQPQVKDDQQKEIDSLFEESEFVLNECEIGSTYMHKEVVEDNHNAITMMTQKQRCQLGYHDLILVEPIGINCSYCKIVFQEMNDILPKLVNRTKDKREWFDLRRMDSSILDRFGLDDLASENRCRSTKLSGSVLNLIPTKMRSAMCLHQRDGFEFLWKNIAGETSIENLTTLRPDGGTGCIISHAPGTGKTCFDYLLSPNIHDGLAYVPTSDCSSSEHVTYLGSRVWKMGYRHSFP